MDKKLKNIMKVGVFGLVGTITYISLNPNTSLDSYFSGKKTQQDYHLNRRHYTFYGIQNLGSEFKRIIKDQEKLIKKTKLEELLLDANLLNEVYGGHPETIGDYKTLASKYLKEKNPIPDINPSKFEKYGPDNKRLLEVVSDELMNLNNN